LGPRASRDATDQDACYRYHYSLSPTCVSEGQTWPTHPCHQWGDKTAGSGGGL